MEIEKTWAELKTLYTDKKSVFQYDESTGSPIRYKVFITEGGIVYSTLFNSNTASGSDFETNYKTHANSPLTPSAADTTPYVRVTEKTVGKMMQIYGFEFVATASDTTDYEVKWVQDVEFVGAIAKSEGAHTGDTVNMQIVDVDNILGYGSDFVVTEFGKNVPGKMIEAKCEASTTTAATVMAGLYIRIQYINIHATEDVEMYGTLRYYH